MWMSWASQQIAIQLDFHVNRYLVTAYNSLSHYPFPDTASRFSQLHHNSRYLKEAAAQVFFWVLASIAKTMPKICLLENVCGILRVWDKVTCLVYSLWFSCPCLWSLSSKATVWSRVQLKKFNSEQVWKILKKLEKYGYVIGKIVVDPIYLGDAAKRRRIYILAIHRSVLRADIRSHQQLEAALEATLSKIQLPGDQHPDPKLELNVLQNGCLDSCLLQICIKLTSIGFTKEALDVSWYSPWSSARHSSKNIEEATQYWVGLCYQDPWPLHVFILGLLQLAGVKFWENNPKWILMAIILKYINNIASGLASDTPGGPKSIGLLCRKRRQGVVKSLSLVLALILRNHETFPDQIDPKKVAALLDVGCYESIKSQRQRHATWFNQDTKAWHHVPESSLSPCSLSPQLSEVMAILNECKRLRGFTNLSQSLDRCGYSYYVPCITPRGAWILCWADFT